ncbi:hypothetical protein FB451DRAFT_1375593 [Mycena latifolia]|nr:hypothetical protein FB451DRAFT_1375593 [Mycena latifolia]
MTYHPATASPITTYLAEAVGPYPDFLDQCDYGHNHVVTIFSGERQVRGKPAPIKARIGQWYAWCNADSQLKCRRLFGPLLPNARSRALEAGIAELKTLIPTARGRKDDRKEKKAPAVKETTATATAAKTQPAKMPDVDPDQIDEYDAYSALAYETAGLPTRRVTLIIYDTPGHPKYYVVWLRYLGCFDFSYFRIARDVQAMHDNEEQRVAFQRYCVFTNEFKPETLKPINMEQRGAYMVYRKASLDNKACLGIEEWKTRAEESAVYDFESDSESDSDHDDEDDQDEESGSYKSDEIQVVSSSFRASSPSSYAGSSSGLGISQSASST